MLIAGDESIDPCASQFQMVRWGRAIRGSWWYVRYYFDSVTKHYPEFQEFPRPPSCSWKNHTYKEQEILRTALLMDTQASNNSW